MSLRRLALMIGFCTLLAACSTSSPPMQRFPELTFRNIPPVQLDIGRIEVVPQYQPPAQAPHIESDMPVSPENAVKRWVQDHLQPIGRNGTLRVVIRDASATELNFKTDKSFTGMFKKEQAGQVDMSVDVALQMLDERQFVIAEVTGQQSRSHTELEGMKLNERDKLLYDMVEDLMKGLNKEVDGKIRATFGNWLGAR
ncbi:MAG TPA: hypothetical protein VN809_03190 [Telmatospirillum sp.]|nr:hypothetical protein [Telmatospirillum sp.]